MRKELTIPAYAKINLTLDITARRQDGYHELESLMQQVSLHDDVILTVEDGDSITVSSDKAFVPAGEDNIAYRAARELLRHIGESYKVDIFIKKRIPVEGGMAGGSTDAAAVLAGLNKMLALNLSLNTLMSLGLRLGADVPFCIAGGTAVARGIGELLEPLQAPPKIWMVIVKPPFGVSTAHVYRNFSFRDVSQRPDLPVVLEGIRRGETNKIFEGMGNVLEPVTFKLQPGLAELKEKLFGWGAEKVMMSGSGPTLLAFVASGERAVALAEKAERNLPASHNIMVAHTLGGKEGGKGDKRENI